MSFDSSSLERSFRLSQQHVDDAVSPHDLASVLAENGARYVMIGGHVLGYFTGTPRARSMSTSSYPRRTCLEPSKQYRPSSQS